MGSPRNSDLGQLDFSFASTDGDWFLGGSPKRVLVVNPLRSYWSLQMCLEAALTYQSSACEVAWLDLPLSLGSLAEVCQVTPSHRWRRWVYRDPSRMAAAAIKSLGVNVLESRRNHQVSSISRSYELPDSREALESWVLGSFPIGQIVSSGVAGTVKERYFDLKDHAQLARDLKDVALLVRRIVERAIDEFRPDVLVTTNDRLVPSAVATHLARSSGISVQVVYWGAVDTIHGYSPSLFEPSTWRRHIEQAWAIDRSNPIAVRSCDHAITQAGVVGLRHTEDQAAIRDGLRSGLVPAKSERKRCVHFAGTPWEFAVGREYPPKVFRSEIEAVEHLCSLLPADEWEVLIRHHPPWGEFGDKSERHAWNRLDRYPHVTHIDAVDPMDSLELAHSADLSTTWESSIGVELLARGQHVFALGDPTWADPSWGITVRTPEQLQTALRNPPSVVDRVALRPYFNFLRGRGRPFRFVAGHGTDISVAGKRVFQVRLSFFDRIRGELRRAPRTSR